MGSLSLGFPFPSVVYPSQPGDDRSRKTGGRPRQKMEGRKKANGFAETTCWRRKRPCTTEGVSSVLLLSFFGENFCVFGAKPRICVLVLCFSLMRNTVFSVRRFFLPSVVAQTDCVLWSCH